MSFHSSILTALSFSSMDFTAACLLAASAGSFCFLVARNSFFPDKNDKMSHLKLPPGPKGSPFVGNASQMPISESWLTFTDWFKKWGDVVYVHCFGSPFIILSSYKAAVELLDKRSTIYSDRPRMIMAGELMGWNFSVTFEPYGERHRKHRKIMHFALNPRSATDFYPLQEKETYKYLRQLLDTPEDHRDKLHKTQGGIVLKAAYGHDLIQGHQEYLDMAEKAVEGFSAAVTGYWVDFLPFLRYVPKWFPGAHFKHEAEAWLKDTVGMYEQPFARLKAARAAGMSEPSFCSNLLDEKESTGDKDLDEELIRSNAGTFFAAGSDTTVAAINTFFLAMTLFPSVQQKAQEELDRVVGNGRLPTLADREDLPYIECLMKETFRFHPAVPTGVPHRLMKDDEYRGYKIPKDSKIISNIWAMAHDPEEYEKPDEFIPERFLDPKTQDPRSFIFGFGRRVCPGRHLAEASVFIAIASILSVFNICKARDENGNEITPPIKFESGIVSHPIPFRCDFKPRSEAAEALIVHASDDL